jgi:hypothetical protein
MLYVAAEAATYKAPSGYALGYVVSRLRRSRSGGGSVGHLPVTLEENEQHSDGP